MKLFALSLSLLLPLPLMATPSPTPITTEYDALEYCTKNSNTFIAIIYPIAVGKDEELKKVFSQFGNIVYRQDISYHEHLPLAMTYFSYQHCAWLGTTDDLSSPFNRLAQVRYGEKYKGNPTRIIMFTCPSPEDAIECKTQIRKIFNVEKYSIHVFDTHEESLEFANILLKKYGKHLLLHAHPRYIDQVNHLLDAYRAQQKHCADCCLPEDVTLALYGIKECPSISNTLQQDVQYLAIAKEDYINYRGFKLLSLKSVMVLKQHRNKLQDIQDLELINNYIGTLDYDMQETLTTIFCL